MQLNKHVAENEAIIWPIWFDRGVGGISVSIMKLAALFLLVGLAAGEKKTASLDQILDMDFKVYKEVYSKDGFMPMGDMEGEGIKGIKGTMKGLGDITRSGPATAQADQKELLIEFNLVLGGLELDFETLEGPFGVVEEAKVKFGKHKIERKTHYLIKEDGSCDAEESIDLTSISDVTLTGKDFAEKDVTEWAADKLKKAFHDKFSTISKDLKPEVCRKLRTPFMGSYV